VSHAGLAIFNPVGNPVGEYHYNYRESKR
jgi:hypothetical protein